MEIDLEHVGDGSLAAGAALSAEVCVVGAGIAGLLLAHRLAEHGVDVVLLEAGGREPGAGQIEAGDTVSALGGTSLVWGGQLLAVQDTEGWPVSAAELARYYPEIENLLGVDSLPYEAGQFQAEVGVPTPLDVEPGSGLVARVSKFAPFLKRNLGASLGQQLVRHSRGRIALHARAVEVLLARGADRATGVRVRTRSGGLRTVHARHVVLAAGTVETCRLLLASRSMCPAGVGNGAGQVGLNFHDHLTVSAATFTGRSREVALRCFRPWLVGGLGGTVHSVKLETSAELRGEQELPFVMGHLTFAEPEGGGMATLRTLLRSRQAGQRWPSRGQLGGASRGLRELWAMWAWAAERQQRYVSPEAQVSLQVNAAQREPSSARVMLRGEVDRWGDASATVERRVTAEDVGGLRALARRLRMEFSRRGMSEADGMEWNASLLDGNEAVLGLDDARHAMGGACMGTDPGRSVVDGALAVHGIANLHVASAAVLPDGRAQLPTLTLMALSLRLADRLWTELARVR